MTVKVHGLEALGGMMDSVLWVVEQKPTQVDEQTLYPTHSGVLTIGETSLRVYRLNDGSAVIDADDFAKIFTSKYPAGSLLIQNGQCPIGATAMMACWFCQFGHATECHHPHDCQTAQCSHLEKYK